MSKYIIDLRPDCKVVQQICAIDKGINIGSRSIGLLDELTDDYVKENFKDLLEGEYQRGLDDAWEAAKKVVLNRDDGGLSILELNEIFNCATIQQVFRKYTLSEAIAKLKAYEEKQKTDNCIEIGDEVKWDGNKCIVTYRHIDINTGVIRDYDLMACDGSLVVHVKKCSFAKTGRHFDIASILEDMKHD